MPIQRASGYCQLSAGFREASAGRQSFVQGLCFNAVSEKAKKKSSRDMVVMRGNSDAWQ